MNSYILKKLVDRSPSDILRSLRERLQAKWRSKRMRQRDLQGDTALLDLDFARLLGRSTVAEAIIALSAWRTEALGIVASGAGDGVLAEMSDSSYRRILSHQFDLLGSDSVRVDYECQVADFEGHRYEMAPGKQAAVAHKERMKCLLGLDGEESGSPLHEACAEYEPIDWHRDFKSGYRWSPDVWYLDLVVGDGTHLGADLKLPWELSRCQHLPRLVLAAGNRRERERAACEYTLQVADWIAANPPKFGCNWRVSMEVAVRSANWLLAFDLMDRRLRPDGMALFQLAKSLYQHGLHIEANLEYHPRVGGNNHYMANVVGLLFLGYCCPWAPQSAAWLAFGLQETIDEARKQIHSDGGHFEGSTHYHRYVGEMLLHGTALVLNGKSSRLEAAAAVDPRTTAFPRLRPFRDQEYDLQKSEIFPSWYLDRLSAMAHYTREMTKADGRVPQLGDNDNGRWFQLSEIDPSGANPAVPRDYSDHRHLLGLAGRLLGDGVLCGAAGECLNEARLFVGDGLDRAETVGVPAVQRQGEGLHYTKSGFAVFKGRYYHLAICGRSTAHGHAHNDLLSFELQIRGCDIIVDGGSYCYSPSAEWRNRFRSTRAHSTLSIEGEEQNTFDVSGKDLFSILDEAEPRIARFTADMLQGHHAGYRGGVHRRTFLLRPGGLVIRDEYEGDSWCHLNLAPAVCWRHGHLVVEDESGCVVKLDYTGFDRLEEGEGCYSPCYGLRQANCRLDLHRCQAVTEIHMKWENS